MPYLLVAAAVEAGVRLLRDPLNRLLMVVVLAVVVQVLLKYPAELEPSSFKISDSHKLAAMSWSDNLFTFASSAVQACKMMLAWSVYLWNVCGLRLKTGSHEVISSSTRLYDDGELQVGGVAWRHVSTLQALGQCMSCTGDQSEDRKRLKRSWEAAFWRNSRVLTCEAISATARLRFWGMISKGIGCFRYSIWVPNKSAAKQVEAGHNKILQRILRIQPLEGESPATYMRRRNGILARERERLGLSVASEWSLSLVRWLEHLGRHPEQPASLLLNVQTDMWLQTLRALHWTPSRDVSLLSGATGTRSGRGKPIRWAEQWVERLRETWGIDNPERDKVRTKQRAEWVRNPCMRD